MTTPQNLQHKSAQDKHAMTEVSASVLANGCLQACTAIAVKYNFEQAERLQQNKPPSEEHLVRTQVKRQPKSLPQSHKVHDLPDEPDEHIGDADDQQETKTANTTSLAGGEALRQAF